MPSEMSLAEIDQEIVRLQEVKQRVQTLLHNPEDGRKRRARRGIAFGRWAETVALSPEHTTNARALTDEADHLLFDEEVLPADGWRYVERRDRWSRPQVRRT